MANSSYLNIITFLLTTVFYYMVLKPTFTFDSLGLLKRGLLHHLHQQCVSKKYESWTSENQVVIFQMIGLSPIVSCDLTDLVSRSVLYFVAIKFIFGPDF